MLSITMAMNIIIVNIMILNNYYYNLSHIVNHTDIVGYRQILFISVFWSVSHSCHIVIHHHRLVFATVALSVHTSICVLRNFHTCRSVLRGFFIVIKIYRLNYIASRREIICATSNLHIQL